MTHADKQPSQILWTPEDIDVDAYTSLATKIFKSLDKPLYLFCRGDGGGLRYTMAIIDAIKYHGDVTGLLLSESNSAHSLLFASCQHRYTFPSGRLGVHESGWMGDSELVMDTTYAAFLSTDFAYYNNIMAQIYANSSNKKATFWKKAITKAASVRLTYFSANELISMGMALPVESLPRKTFQTIWAR